MLVELVHGILELVRCRDLFSFLEGGNYKFCIGWVLESKIFELGTKKEHSQTVPVRDARPYVKFQYFVGIVL